MFRSALRAIPRAPAAALGSAAGVAAYFAQPQRHHFATAVCEPSLECITGVFKGKAPTKCADSHAPMVIVGPSGVGKGTLIKIMMKAYPDKFGFCVSTTTRKPRPGEVDGKDYHFVESEPMQQQIAEGKFVEYAKVHTNHYGTSFAALDAVKTENKIAILDIDVQGAKNVKARIPGARFLFLAPPCMKTLEARLRGRGTETEEKVQVRLQNAIGECEFSKTPGFFDEVLLADDEFVVALPKLKKWLEETYPQLKDSHAK